MDDPRYQSQSSPPSGPHPFSFWPSSPLPNSVHLKRKQKYQEKKVNKQIRLDQIKLDRMMDLKSFIQLIIPFLDFIYSRAVMKGHIELGELVNILKHIVCFSPVMTALDIRILLARRPVSRVLFGRCQTQQ